ncbi:hypothetical protein [Nocardia sp. NPDC057353]|uniref:hypothetical protein n=1 Tax=Nocardia sp. NPDC057353 TaxID=3346104 RepID=UPI003638ADC9
MSDPHPPQQQYHHYPQQHDAYPQQQYNGYPQPQHNGYPQPQHNAYPQQQYNAYPGPGAPFYQPYPVAPPRMPGSVRSAQIVAWLMGAAGIALIGVAIGTGRAELAGQLTAGFLLPIITAGMAFAFGSAGNGLRVTAIVLASLQALFSFGAMASMQPPGLLGVITGITVICLLAPAKAKQWFERPR